MCARVCVCGGWGGWGVGACACVYVSVCVCVCVSVCTYVSASVCVCVCALRIVSTDKILCFINNLIIKFIWPHNVRSVAMGNQRPRCHHRGASDQVMWVSPVCSILIWFWSDTSRRLPMKIVTVRPTPVNRSPGCPSQPRWAVSVSTKAKHITSSQGRLPVTTHVWGSLA